HLPVQHRKIEQRSRHDADIDHVDATRKQPLEQQVAQPRRGEPAVASERNFMLACAMQHRRVAMAEVDNEIVGEILFDNSPDVVLAKNLAIHSPLRSVAAAQMLTL